MGPKEGTGPDSDGPLEIPQRFEHSKAVPRFPSLQQYGGVDSLTMAEVATLKESMVDDRAEFRDDSPSSRGTASSEGTIDLDKIDAGSTQAKDILRSSVIWNNDLTTSVSSSFCVWVRTDARSHTTTLTTTASS